MFQKEKKARHKNRDHVTHNDKDLRDPYFLGVAVASFFLTTLLQRPSGECNLYVAKKKAVRQITGSDND